MALGDLNIETASVLANELSAEGGEVVAWQYDQSDETTISALVESVATHFGGLDGVFANVADIEAVLVDGDILSNDSALWERTLKINVWVRPCCCGPPCRICWNEGAVPSF